MCDLHRRGFIGRSLGIGLGVGALAVAGFGSASAQEPAKAAAPAGAKWICPPCGCPSDGQEFDKAGACPSCGMILIPKPAPAAASTTAAPKAVEAPAKPGPTPEKAPKAGP